MADPFADRNALDANPFADPSVQNALSGSRGYEADSGPSYPAASYEPGADDPYQTGANASRAEASKLEEIQRRERELEAREAELANRTEHIRKHGRNNWPFFYPLIYHDIASEIPADAQPTMINLYRLWLLLALTLIINMVACIFLLIQGASDGAKDMISGIVYVPVIIVTSFLLWYRPIYNGFMKEHSLFYYVYFVFCGFHLAYSAYMFIGIPSTGSAGLLNTIQAFSNGHLVAAILGTVTTVGLAVQGLGNLWYYRLIWQHNHEREYGAALAWVFSVSLRILLLHIEGHTFAQAKAEFASHGAKAYFTRGNQV